MDRVYVLLIFEMNKSLSTAVTHVSTEFNKMTFFLM